MYYFKRYWDESTGNTLTDSWGTSCFYFETEADGTVIRQIQVFDNNNALKYTVDYDEDGFGGLSEIALEIEEFERYHIEQSEFEWAWATVPRYASSA